MPSRSLMQASVLQHIGGSADSVDHPSHEQSLHGLLHLK